MKIAIIGDTHFGYSRFEEDAFIQAERALMDANQKADLIIHAGDMFDTKVPKLETLNRSFSIFKQIEKPIVAIFGNHERRSKDLINPVQLLAATGVFTYLHGTTKTFENDGQKVQIFGMSSVPEEYASVALKKLLENFKPIEGFNILVIHQSIKELMVKPDQEISLEELEHLPFDLIINGHIHNKHSKLGGKFLIPGSTIITQLKKEETDPRTYYLYDTKTKQYETIDFGSRKFFFEELFFENASIEDIRNKVKEKTGELKNLDKEAIVKIKIKGTLKEGINPSDLSLPSSENVYLDNQLDSTSLKEKINKIRELRSKSLSVREFVMKELDQKLKGKIKFDSYQLFEKLLQGPDETLEWIQEQYKKQI